MTDKAVEIRHPNGFEAISDATALLSTENLQRKIRTKIHKIPYIKKCAYFS